MSPCCRSRPLRARYLLTHFAPRPPAHGARSGPLRPIPPPPPHGRRPPAVAHLAVAGSSLPPSSRAGRRPRRRRPSSRGSGAAPTSPDLSFPGLPRPPPRLRPLSGESLRRDPCCIEIRAKNPRSGGPISTKSPSFPCFKCPCSSCRNFASVAPFCACSISKCSSQRVHHLISLHHFHLSSSRCPKCCWKRAI